MVTLEWCSYFCLCHIKPTSEFSPVPVPGVSPASGQEEWIKEVQDPWVSILILLWVRSWHDQALGPQISSIFPALPGPQVVAAGCPTLVLCKGKNSHPHPRSLRPVICFLLGLCLLPVRTLASGMLAWYLLLRWPLLPGPSICIWPPVLFTNPTILLSTKLCFTLLFLRMFF